MPTISRLYPTGVLETTKELDEVTYNSIKVGVDGVYAAQFDETNLDIGTAERRTSDGTYMVSGYFDEYTMLLPAAPSQVAFTTAGTYTWTAPLGVTSVSVVCVGGGAGGGAGGFEGSGITGGGGGGLGWKNNITVIPEQTYTVVVGVGGNSTSIGGTFISTQGGVGGDSYFINRSTVKGGGAGAASGATFVFQNVGFNYSVDGFADDTFPTLTLVRGQTYNFNFTNITSSHPIALRLASGSASAVPGATGNNASTGVFGTTVTYQVPVDAPSTIYYQCVFHSGMIGTINIVNALVYTGTGGTYTGDGGGNGGISTPGSSGGAGGGAGGYAGTGGTGGPNNSNNDDTRNGTAGCGGGGGGGATTASGGSPHGGGGGVGILGQGSSGAGGVYTGGSKTGTGGSGGANGNSNFGGLYGGGGASALYGFNQSSGSGTNGAVRIMWGAGRAFPSTQTVDI